RLGLYPPALHGGNGRHAYADVEAVRVLARGTDGPRALLREAWTRYRLPLAVTEVHLGCTREEQLRWFLEVWDAAQGLRREGADLRAVTAWALFGSFDWDSLVTRASGYYEPGAFDVRPPRPRPTATAHLIRDLARGAEHEHPALAAPGWWRRLDRLTYAPQRQHARGAQTGGEAPPLLITGATGTLGAAFARVAESRALPHRLLSRREMDIADPESVERALEGAGAWALVNAAGYVRVDDAEREAESCFRENTEGARVLAEACARRGVKLVTFSSDLVFDGRGRREPYVESDAVSPLGVYGRSKAEAERLVLELLPTALVVRTSAFFGPWDEYNFLHAALAALSRGEEFVAADDAHVTPTYVPELAHACLDLLVDGEGGVWHLANSGAVTWADLARRAARLAGLDERLVKGRPTGELNLAAPRPAYSALGTERGALLGTLDEALARFMREGGADTPSLRRARTAAG
ncbi:MAG TPA: SDR family oxidoreductase, partial [Pyrinomonadaceae bacterium]